MKGRKRILADTLMNPFDIQRFTRFVNAFFGNDGSCPEYYDKQDTFGTLAKPAPDKLKELPGKYSVHISGFRLIEVITCRACCKTDEKKKIAIIAVQLSERAQNERSGRLERSYSAELLKYLGCDSAIAAFYIEGKPDWRLSYIKPGGGDSKDSVYANRTSWPASGGFNMADIRIAALSGFKSAGYTGLNQLLKHLNKFRDNAAISDIEKAFSHAIFIKSFLKAHDAGCDIINTPMFSTRESEPSDRLLAVDPEMLGRLLENSLNDSEKKSRGAFYTPAEVVHFMCRESLAQYLANKADVSIADIEAFLRHGDRAEDENDVHGLPDSVRNNLYEIDSALENIKVYDPAAGSGAFVMGMLQAIVKTRLNISSYLAGGLRAGEKQEYKTCPDKRHPYMLKLHAIKNCLWATDIDSRAVEITKLRLWYSLAAEHGAGICQQELPCFYEFRKSVCGIVCADALQDNETGRFDIVIGNPPYISAVEEANSGYGMRQAMKSRYPILKGSFDIYTAFLLEGVLKTNKYGIYCWIIPNKLLVSGYAAPVLEYLKQNGLIMSISISDIDVFSRAGIYPVIIVGNKGKTGKEAEEGFAEYRAGTLEDLECRNFSRKPGLRNYNTFYDFNIRFASGAAGFQAGDLKQSITEYENAGSIPFIVSGSIDKYSLDCRNVKFMGATYSRAFISKTDKIAQSKWKLWCGEKIVIAGLTREIEAYYCRRPLACGVGTYAIYDFGGFDPLFLLGLLNSSFIARYMNEKFKERHLAAGYLAINKAMLEQLPLVPAEIQVQRNIAQKAAALLELCEKSSIDISPDRYGSRERYKKEMNDLMNKIDEIIYGLYGFKKNGNV